MVSLNTANPDRKAQPATTAIAVSSRRPLRAMVLRSASLNISLTEPLHAVEHALGRGVGHLVDDLAVGEEDDAIRVTGGVGVVRHHHDRLAELAHGAAHEIEDL